MRNSQIVNIRVIAILFVVIGHSIIIFDPRWGVYKPVYSSNLFCIIKEIINTFQMQLFFSISGFLLYYSKNRKKAIDFIIDKFSRLLIPFIIVGLGYLIPIRFLAHYPKYDYYLSAVKDFFLKNDCGHLWFLPTLFGIFMIFYFFKPYTEKLGKYAFCSIFLFAVISFFSNHILSILFLNSIAKWFVFFLLGFYINMYRHIIFDPKYNKLWYFITFCLPFILYIRFNISLNGLDSSVRFLFSILFVLCAYRFITYKSNKVVSFFDRNSYGIYLFHAPIVYIMYDNYYYLSPFILFSLTFITAFSGALLITLFLRKIKFGFVLGEK